MIMEKFFFFTKRKEIPPFTTQHKLSTFIVIAKRIIASQLFHKSEIKNEKFFQSKRRRKKKKMREKRKLLFHNKTIQKYETACKSLINVKEGRDLLCKSLNNRKKHSVE